jgi:hypothetical protein
MPPTMGPCRLSSHPALNAFSKKSYLRRSTNPAHIGTIGTIGNIKLRTGIRLPARTMAGAHIKDAAAPMTMLLRVISPSALKIFDEHPWHRLYPIEVHPDFAQRIWEAVKKRLDQDTLSGHPRPHETNMLRWHALCGTYLDQRREP